MFNHKIDTLLFSPVNPKNLVVFRVLVAAMLAIMFAPRSSEPIYPLTNFPQLIEIVTRDGYFILIYILIFLFAVGVKPRLITLLLFLVLLPHDLFSEGRKSKQVILCVLLCFVFLKSLPIWKINQKTNILELSPIWPIRLIQFQLTLIYGINALAKTTLPYLSGDVLVEMSMAYSNFHIDLSDGYYHILSLKIPVYVLAISSVLVEYFLAIGLWFRKTKWIAVFVGISFHLYLTTIMSIFMLDYVSMFLYLAFIIPFKMKPINNIS